MRMFLYPMLFGLLAASAFSSPQRLADGLARALLARDESVLGKRIYATGITGDIPLGRGLFRSGQAPADVDGISEVVPPRHAIASIRVLSDEESRQIESRSYVQHAQRGYGYIRVDFRRQDGGEAGTRVGAFSRFYPYIRTEKGFSWLVAPGRDKG